MLPMGVPPKCSGRYLHKRATASLPQSASKRENMESIETLTQEEARLLAQKLKIKKLEYSVQEQAQKNFLPLFKTTPLIS